MSYALYYDAPGNAQMYARVTAVIGDERPPGRVLHLVTAVDAGLRHLSVWESRDDWLAFRDTRVRPAVAEVLTELGIPAPTDQPQEHELRLVDAGA